MIGVSQKPGQDAALQRLQLLIHGLFIFEFFAPARFEEFQDDAAWEEILRWQRRKESRNKSWQPVQDCGNVILEGGANDGEAQNIAM